jgi:photosystem II stability/assembly factor-like uncharacterized protein
MNTPFPFPLLAISMLAAATTATAQNWTSIPTPVTTNLILYDIDFPAGQNSIGYAGGSNVTYNGHGTILRSVDEGSSWDIVWSSTASGTGVTALYFLNVDTGFAGTQGGELMMTTDGGTTWTSSDFDGANDQGEIEDVQFRDALHGVLSTGWNGIYTTSDGGVTWTPATTNPATTQYALCYADANTVFACGNDQTIFKSTDGGATWASAYQGSPQTVNLGIDFLDADHGMVTSEEGQYFSTADGGTTWTPGTIPGQSGLMRGVVMLDEENIFVCATPGQVFRTVNGGTTWTDDSGVDFDPSYYAILFTPDGTGFVSGSGATGGTILKRAPITTGLPEHAAADGAIKAWPNPASTMVTVEVAGSWQGQEEITVVNGLGEVVQSTAVTPPSAGPARITVDLTRLSPGLYTVNLSTGSAVTGSQRVCVTVR